MTRWFRNRAGMVRAARRPGTASRSVRPAVLALEDRLVPAAPTPTDMTELARLFPRHAGPTTLYVNFDGWQSEGVSPFMSVSGDRDKDIQDILFRTAEIFSPFDVQVVRRFGDGDRATDGGASTIFVGDKSGNGTGTANIAYSYTPASSVDFPGNGKGIFHQPNSDGADTAFVDPVEYSPMPSPNGNVASLSTVRISQAIAHEGGHTFGLAHVLTAPDEDVMSYNAVNSHFADTTYSITDLNNNGGTLEHSDGVVPKWHVQLSFPFPLYVSYKMLTQNSYTDLLAELGARPADDYANVAQGYTVSHFADTAPAVARGSLLNGTIDRAGDYDVFRFTPAVTQTLNVSALRGAGASVNTAVMIYQGDFLVAFNNDRTAADAYSQVTYNFVAGQSYRIVVGSANALGAGAYRLWVSAPGDPNPDHTGPRVVTSEVTYSIKGIPTGILVTFNEDIDPSTFTAADVSFVSAANTVRHPSSVQAVTGRQFRIAVNGIPMGDYTLKIGPDVRDFAGNEMNQDGDTVNGEATDVYSELIFLERLGLDDPIGPGGKPGQIP